MNGIVRAAVLVAALALAVPASGAAAEAPIGLVRSSTGQAVVTRGGQVLPAVPGTKLFAGDILGTGADGTLGVILNDNSTLSLGPGSSLAIRKFLFSPKEGKLGLVARLSRGTMAYISGLIGKLAPESARFETPVASIGIRGTRFAVKAGERPPQ